MSFNTLETKTKSEQRDHLGLGHWVSSLVSAIKDATVTIWQISSAKMHSTENVIFSFLAGDHQSTF